MDCKPLALSKFGGIMKLLKEDIGEKVGDYINQERKWKKLLKEEYPQEDKMLIKGLEDVLKDQRLPLLPHEDFMTWDLNPNGNFTVKSAYSLLVNKEQCPVIWKKVWISNLIPKINFFWWTVQHGKILTIDNLKKRGLYLTNRCSLCKEKEESIYHLFIECKFANDIWTMVWEKLGIDWVMKDNLGQFVENWDCPFHHPRLILLWKYIPAYVCWHIWKERNNRIFREESRPAEVVFRVMNNLLKENLKVAKCKMPMEQPRKTEGTVAENWGCSEDFLMFDNRARRRRQQTRWSPPTITQCKLNFDGAAKGGEGAAGGVLRDRNGDALLVYSGYVGKGSNNVAEAMALLWGLQFIRERNISEITIEGDSKLVIDLVKGEAKAGWNIKNIVSDIKLILEGMRTVHLQHIYREGNQVADAAAAIGFNRREVTCWESINDINENIRTLIDMEKSGKIYDEDY